MWLRNRKTGGWFEVPDEEKENNNAYTANSFITSFNKQGKGYIGKSMSVNAKNAYESGERPESKWTKDLMIREIEENIDNVDSDVLHSLTKEELFREYFEESGWHHTGALYNKTYFYKLRDDIKHINKDDIKRIKNNSKELKERRIKKEAEEKEKQIAINKAQAENKKLVEEDSLRKSKYKPSAELVNKVKDLGLIFSANNEIIHDFKKRNEPGFYTKSESHHDGIYKYGRYLYPSWAQENNITPEKFYNKNDFRIVEIKDNKGIFKEYQLQYWNGHKWIVKAK